LVQSLLEDISGLSLTTLSKPVGRFRGGLRVVSEHLDHMLEEVAARRGALHVRAAAAVFRCFALQSGCSEIDILDFEMIRKGKKQPNSEAVLEAKIGWLREALARWLHPAHTDFLDNSKGKRERAQRVSELLKRHFEATIELEGAIKAGLEEGVEEEKVAGHGTSKQSTKKQKVLVEGVAEAAGGLTDNLTPMKITLPLVSKKIKLEDEKDDAVKTKHNTKDIASYFVRKC
jgi:hypothetical protein